MFAHVAVVWFHLLFLLNCQTVGCELSRVLLTNATAQVAQDPVGARVARSGGRRKVCVGPWTPMGICPVGLIGEPGDSRFTGYQVEYFKILVADKMGWQREDWFFHCMNFSLMVADILDPNGSCYVSTSSWDATQPADGLPPDKWLKFTWPTWSGGWKILISSQQVRGGTWAIFSAFDWTVWLLLGLTAHMVGATLWCTERCVELVRDAHRAADKAEHPGSGRAAAAEAQPVVAAHTPYTPEQGTDGWWQRQQSRSPAAAALAPRQLAAFGDILWEAMRKMVEMGDPNPKTLPSRIIVLVYGLLVLLMVALYTAITAANVMTVRLSNSIRSKEDLYNRRVGTWAPYGPLLIRHFGIRTVPLVWENRDDELAMVAKLRSGELDAIILDDPLVNYYAATECDLFAVGESLNFFQYSMMFPADFPDSIVQSFNQAMIQENVEHNLMGTLAEHYIRVKDSCRPDLQQGVTVSQVAGLWIILAAATGFCFAMLGLAYLGRHQRHIRRLSAAWLSNLQLQHPSSKPGLYSSWGRSLSMRSQSWSRGRRSGKAPAGQLEGGSSGDLGRDQLRPWSDPGLHTLQKAASGSDGPSMYGVALEVVAEEAEDQAWQQRRKGNAAAKDMEMGAAGSAEIRPSTAVHDSLSEGWPASWQRGDPKDAYGAGPDLRRPNPLGVASGVLAGDATFNGPCVLVAHSSPAQGMQASEIEIKEEHAGGRLQDWPAGWRARTGQLLPGRPLPAGYTLPQAALLPAGYPPPQQPPPGYPSF